MAERDGSQNPFHPLSCNRPRISVHKHANPLAWIKVLAVIVLNNAPSLTGLSSDSDLNPSFCGGLSLDGVPGKASCDRTSDGGQSLRLPVSDEGSEDAARHRASSHAHYGRLSAKDYRAYLQDLHFVNLHGLSSNSTGI